MAKAIDNWHLVMRSTNWLVGCLIIVGWNQGFDGFSLIRNQSVATNLSIKQYQNNKSNMSRIMMTGAYSAAGKDPVKLQKH